jgi:hypothetical protein
MPPVRPVHRAVAPRLPAHGGKLELHLPGIPSDVRAFFLVSLLAYASWDLAVRPLLHWAISSLWH